MADEKEEVRRAALRFYDALEAMLSGKGAGAMSEAWHHTDAVTSGHPIGEWSQGWDEISATWEEFANLGKPGNGGTKISALEVRVYGDVAYTIGVFTAAPAFGGGRMNVTNILHRANGVWKVIHHHADRTPSLEAAVDKELQAS
jgi:ketosteroid isomerase-like protein